MFTQFYLLVCLLSITRLSWHTEYYSSTSGVYLSFRSYENKQGNTNKVTTCLFYTTEILYKDY